MSNGDNLEALLGYIAGGMGAMDGSLLGRLEGACLASDGARHLYGALVKHGVPMSRQGYDAHLKTLGLTPNERAASIGYFNHCQMAGTRIKSLADAGALVGAVVASLDAKQLKASASQLMRDGKVEDAQTLLQGHDVDLSQVKQATYRKLQRENGIVKATDIGVAQLFADRRGADSLYVSEWKRWLRWSGKQWKSISDDAMGKTVIDFCRYDLLDYAAAIDDDAKRGEFLKFAIRCQSANAVANILSLASKLLAKSADVLDADANALNLQNGTLDLVSYQLRAHRREDYLTKIGKASYVADGRDSLDGSRWEAFLETVVPDADVRLWLQRAVGYTLTASVDEERMMLLVGGGRNGKTTFTNAVRHVLGDYAMQGDQQLLTYKSANMKGNNSDATADLVGRRFVVVSETADGDRLDEAKVKDLVSNKPIHAMRKYERAFEFRPTHKLWLDTNHLPKVRGVDDGIWRRLSVVRFDVQIAIDDVDHALGDKLADDADAILAWAIAGLKAYREKGLSEPTAMRTAKGNYQNESDVVKTFIGDCVRADASGQVAKPQLYKAYRGWLDENGYAFPLTAQAFDARLKAMGWKDARKASGRFWLGHSLADATHMYAAHAPYDEDDRGF